MSDIARPETHAKIIAEARNRYTVHNCNQCEYRKSCDLGANGFDSDECRTRRQSIMLGFGIEDGYFTKILDRLDAAHKREMSKSASKNGADFGQLGDCAKLREALKLCVDELCSRCRDLAAARGNPLPCLNGCESVRKAKAALAEPVRNCDVIGNTGRALAVYGFPTTSKPWGEGEWLKLIDWLFAPATEKEGGSK